MTNASTIRLILAVLLTLWLFAALPYEAFDIASTAWADKGDDDDDDENDDDGGKKGGGGGKKGGGGGKESGGGKGSKSGSDGDAGSTGGNDAGTGDGVASDPAADSGTTTDITTVATSVAPGDVTAEPTTLILPNESNDDDERRRAADFFVGMEAYEQADYELALSRWLPLAEHGHAAAQAGVGAVYYRFRQHADAFRWSRAAARQGHSDAAFNLAVLYQFALGAPLSMTRAMFWYGEAASRGHRKSALALRRLRDGPLAALLVPVPIPKPGPAERFAKRRRMEEAQILLATLGYDPGRIDGQFGPRTKTAIERFEQDHGLFIRGRANEALLVNLRRAAIDGAATVISTR